MREHLKNSFKESFQHKAPEGFTDNLMKQLSTRKQLQASLLPKTILWFIASSFFILIGMYLWSIRNTIDYSLPTSQLIDFLNSFLPSLILPMSIAALLLLQQLFHYRKIS